MSESVHQEVQEPDNHCLDAKGPWPFVTSKTYQLADQKRRVWCSRQHRKELLESEGKQTDEATTTQAMSVWRWLANSVGCRS